nr:hypothetical protein [uncultured Flavobacterium sp.]
MYVKNIIGKEKLFFCSPLGFYLINYSIENLSEDNPFQNLVSKYKMFVGFADSMVVTNALESFIETIKQMSTLTNIHFCWM